MVMDESCREIWIRKFSVLGFWSGENCFLILKCAILMGKRLGDDFLDIRAEFLRTLIYLWGKL